MRIHWQCEEKCKQLRQKLVKVLMENKELKMTARVLETERLLKQTGSAIHYWFLGNHCKLVGLVLDSGTIAIH